MAEVIVLHTTNIQLDTARVGEDPDGNPILGGKMPFRWRGEIDDAEYEATCASDDAAGRPHRLERLDEPKPKPKKRGRPKKADDE